MTLRAVSRHFDVAGAVTVRVALMLAVYAIANGNQAAGKSMQTLGLLVAAMHAVAESIRIDASTRLP